MILPLGPLAKFKELVMGEQQEATKKAESQAPALPPAQAEELASVQEEGKDVRVNDAADEKALASVSQSVAEPVNEKSSRGSNDRDVALARVETEKRYALIKAWEENEKAKAENKAHKKLADVGSWENTKRAAVEAELKKYEEKLERKKAEYAEKMKNKIAEIYKEAEEKRTMVEAKRGEEVLKVEETASKYRATGYTPKKFLGCFSS